MKRSMHCVNAIALIVAILCVEGCGRSGLLDDGSPPPNSIGSDSATPQPVARSGSGSAVAGDGTAMTDANVDEHSAVDASDDTNVTPDAADASRAALTGVAAIAATFGHACGLLTDRTVVCWGLNDFGQLGNGRTGPGTCMSGQACSTRPMAVAGLTGATAVAAGTSHSCALLSSATVECWGDDRYGQLGGGSIGTGSAIPVVVTNLSGVVAIAGAGEHTCALVSGGTVDCWGHNVHGQLGDGTKSDSASAVEVKGLSGVTAISAGRDSTCALVSGGTVECWGGNYAGQLGNGSTTDSSTPVAVSGLAGVTAIAVGWDSGCALLAGGGLSCWGPNGYGQLGNGTTVNSRTPVPVKGLSGVAAITQGFDHGCALLSGGAVQCWGDNSWGQLGNAAAAGPSAPAMVTGLNGAIAVVASDYSTCAVLADGTARCWGLNSYGQLGDGTTTNARTPVAVIR
jgi:alpha-tubulin suppressor-like RCC1 family protein